MKITPELTNRTCEISDELKVLIEETAGLSPGKEFQDYVFLAIYTKLAELQLKIEDLEYRNANT